MKTFYFLVFGRSRSGTTITYKILDNHPEIDITNQAHRFENGLPSGTTRVIGDKSGMPSDKFFEPYLAMRNFFFVYLIRDGRDVVSSGIRLRKKEKLLSFWKKKQAVWKELDPTKSSRHWADGIRAWHRIRNMLPEHRYLELRFEDYLEHPGMNAIKLARFLTVDQAQMYQSEVKFIDPKHSHRGYYIRYIPDWSETFDADAKNLLDEYGYT